MVWLILTNKRKKKWKHYFMHLLFFILAMIALSIFIIKLFGSGIIALITYKFLENMNAYFDKVK